MPHAPRNQLDDRRLGAGEKDPKKGQESSTALEAQRTRGAVIPEGCRRRHLSYGVEDLQRPRLDSHGGKCFQTPHDRR